MTQCTTGVRWYFSASHRRPNGNYHGHTWQVRAWWCEGECADKLISRLRSALTRFDEKQLPDELTRGETLARAIAEELDHLSPPGVTCLAVELAREPEGIYARWGGRWSI